MADVKITCIENGPMKVEGAVEIANGKGEPIAVDPAKPAVFLCRCGHSANKPFCDGAHKREGWKGA